MPRTEPRCGCCGLRTATIAVGIVYTAGALALMVWRVMVAAERLGVPEAEKRGDGVAPIYQALLLTAEATISVLLIVGACTGRHVLVKAWFVFSVSAAVLSSAATVVRASVMASQPEQTRTALVLFGTALLALAISIVSFVIVDKFYTEMLHTRNNRLIGS